MLLLSDVQQFCQISIRFPVSFRNTGFTRVCSQFRIANGLIWYLNLSCKWLSLFEFGPGPTGEPINLILQLILLLMECLEFHGRPRQRWFSFNVIVHHSCRWREGCVLIRAAIVVVSVDKWLSSVDKAAAHLSNSVGRECSIRCRDIKSTLHFIFYLYKIFQVK